MRVHEPAPFSSGHQFLESPRWHDGKLWASDFFTQEVLTFDGDGVSSPVAKVDGTPSGLGFLPDGTPLVVSMAERTIYKILPQGQLIRHADFSAVAGGLGNDMYVSSTGHAYVGNFGFALGEEEPRPTQLAHVHPDGTVEAAPGEVLFPNGTIQTPDGRLLVAETFGHRISAFDIADDGSLTNHRVWAQLDEKFHPDGVALDTDGGLWFGNAIATGEDGGFYRVVEGGELTDRVKVEDAWAVACAFGGDKHETLYLVCNATTLEEFAAKRSAGYIATAHVGRTGCY